MVAKAWRRIIGVGVAAFIACAGTAVAPVPAAAPIDGTLYGTSFPSDIATVDAASGTVTSLVSLAGVGPNPSAMAIAAVAKSGTLDVLVTTCTSCPNAKGGGGPIFYQVAVVDPVSKSVAASPILQRPIAESIAVEPKTHAVLGVVDCGAGACATSSVVMIDPTTGVETDIAALPLPEFFDSKVALDPRSHTLYVLNFGGQLLSVDTSSGAVTTGPALGPNITGMAVDAGNGDLFVLRSNFQQQQLQVDQIDPSTGNSTVLDSFAGFSVMSLAIDSRSHTLFAVSVVGSQFSTEEEMVSINERTGSATFGLPLGQGPGPLAFLHD